MNVGNQTEVFLSNLALPRVHVVTTLNFGGVETQMIELAKFYSGHGLSKHVHFLVLGSGGLAEKEIRNLKCQVHVLSLNYNKQNFKLFMEITNFFRKTKPKVVYFHGAEAILNAVIPSRLCGIKRAITEEIGIPNHSFKAKLIFRVLHRIASAKICATKTVKQWLITNKETIEKRTHITSLPIRRVLSEPRAPNHNNKRLNYLFLGRFEEVKNLREYLNAISILVSTFDFKGREIIFNFVGTGTMLQEIEDFIFTKKLSMTVRIHAPTLDIREYFLSNDFIVQCSISEGFGLTVVEAMQSGLLPISTNVGVIPDLVTDGANGIIIKGKTSADILHALESSLNLSYEDYVNMTQKAIKSSIASFSTQKYMKTLSDVESVLNAKD